VRAGGRNSDSYKNVTADAFFAARGIYQNVYFLAKKNTWRDNFYAS
jgi:uncharacterized MAPEG superfamily protein